jgi:cobalamin biosynthesis protein CbiD
MNSAIFFAVCGQLLSISYDTVVGWTDVSAAAAVAAVAFEADLEAVDVVSVPLPLSMGFNELEFESIAKRRR